MPKRKTEDQLKETISKQNGELQRLRRQLEELSDQKDDAVSEANMMGQRLDDARIRGKNEIEVRNQHDAVTHLDRAIASQRESLLQTIERREHAMLEQLFAKRRTVFELDIDGRIPYINSTLSY